MTDDERRERNNAACRKYRENNPAKRKASLEKYERLNKDRVRLQKLAYKSRNREKVLQVERDRANALYRQNPSIYQEKSRLAREKNPSYHREYNRSWSKTEKGKAVQDRAKAKRRSAERSAICSLTHEQWNDILRYYNFSCAYCSTSSAPITKDHVVPLSKGGHHTKENVVPACKTCNSKKGAKLMRPSKEYHPCRP